MMTTQPTAIKIVENEYTFKINQLKALKPLIPFPSRFPSKFVSCLQLYILQCKTGLCTINLLMTLLYLLLTHLWRSQGFILASASLHLISGASCMLA